MGYQAALVRTEVERAAVFAVRIAVFVEEQAVPLEEELDSYDALATHFLARLGEADSGEEIVGAARLVDRDVGVGKVGRVAVLQEHRGAGVGALLMHCVEKTARERGLIRLDLDAQLHAILFYEKLGYVAEGGIFLDANIEHRHMSKRLD